LLILIAAAIVKSAGLSSTHDLMWAAFGSLGVMLLFGLIEEALERLKLVAKTKAPVEAEFIPPKPEPIPIRDGVTPAPPAKAPPRGEGGGVEPDPPPAPPQSHALPKSFDHGGAKAVWKLEGYPE